MPKVNGATITVTTKIMGRSATDISGIMGVRTSDIPGWPGGGGPSCIELLLGYSPGPPPQAACLASPNVYDYDPVSNILYREGGCGVITAPLGFYSDGRSIYNWDGIAFTSIGRCGG